MKLSERDKHIILLGVVFVALGGYIVVSRTGSSGTGPSGMAPVSEGNLFQASVNADFSGVALGVSMLGIDVNGGITPEARLMHFFDPGQAVPPNPPNQQYTTPRHRYPTVSGTNISTLIHHGYSPLMVPSPRDNDWMWNPPTESYFGG